MATVAPTIVTLPPSRDHQGVTIHQWACALAADDYTAVDLPGKADRTVQASGTWGGGTIVIEGSIDGTTYKTLTDPQGNALSFTADAIEAISENVRYIRPNPSSNVTSVTVSILFRG